MVCITCLSFVAAASCCMAQRLHRGMGVSQVRQPADSAKIQSPASSFNAFAEEWAFFRSRMRRNLLPCCQSGLPVIPECPASSTPSQTTGILWKSNVREPAAANPVLRLSSCVQLLQRLRTGTGCLSRTCENLPLPNLLPIAGPCAGEFSGFAAVSPLPSGVRKVLVLVCECWAIPNFWQC